MESLEINHPSFTTAASMVTTSTTSTSTATSIATAIFNERENSVVNIATHTIAPQQLSKNKEKEQKADLPASATDPFISIPIEAENVIEKIEPHPLPSPYAQKSATNNIVYQRGTTIAEMANNNPHVAALPSYMLGDPGTTISGSDLQAHTSAQLLLYLGVPISTLPALFKNSHSFLIGFGVGAAGGGLISIISSTSLNRLESNWHWLERTAAMNPISKGIIGGLHLGGISANTISSFMAANSTSFAIFQGGIAGSIIGYESVAMVRGLIHRHTDPMPQQNPL